MNRQRQYEVPGYDQARYLVGYIRSLGIEVILDGDAHGMRVMYRPTCDSIRLAPEVKAQLTTLRLAILAVVYDQDCRPIRLAGRRAG